MSAERPAESAERPAESAELAAARAALATLAPDLGLHARDVVAAPVPAGSAAAVPALADALGLRWRPVALGPAERARRTALPLVATGPDGLPYAVTPRRPARGGRGYELYRPLPAGRVGVASLLRFAAAGTGPDLALTALAGAVAGLLAVAVPAVVGLNLVRLVGGAHGWVWTSALAAGACLLACVATIVRNAAAARVQARMQARFEPAVWDRLLGCETSFYRRFSTGDLVHRSAAVATARRALSDALLSSVLGVFFALVGLGVLAVVDPLLAAVLLGVVALAVAAMTLAARARQRHEADVFAEHGRLQGLLYGLLAGVDKLQVAGREDAAFARWRVPFGRQKRADAAAMRADAVVTAVAAGLLPALLAAVLGVVAAGRDVDAGRLLAAGVAASQVAMAVGQLAVAASAAYGIGPVLARLRPVLDAVQEPPAGTGADPGRLRGDVALDAVTFAYPGAARPAVESLSLRAGAGEFVAVVGPSGAGKSTLVRLLLGLEPPASGCVRFDGRPLAELDVREVRRQVGTVLQHARLIRGTLRDNLTGGDPRIGDDDVWAALAAAGLDGDLRRLPLGLATRVGEDGQGFSGGQVQRLHLARALVHGPAVLLLDEATSALDNTTQRLVADRVAALDCTRIVIAHRLSTVRAADRIVVLDGGRVRASGTFDELLGHDEVFTALARPQLARPQLARPELDGPELDGPQLARPQLDSPGAARPLATRFVEA